MKKGTIVNIFGIIIFFVVNASLSYGATPLEEALSQPIEIGFVTLHPGNDIETEGGETIVTNSRLDFFGNALLIPKMTVKLSGSQLIAESDSVTGIIQNDDFGVETITMVGLHIEVDLEEGVESKKLLQKKLMVSKITSADEGDEQLEVIGFSLATKKENHKFWDELQLTIPQMVLHGDDVVGVIQGVQLFQTQKPLPKEKLAVDLQFQLKSLNIIDEENVISAKDIDFGSQMRVNGDENVVIWKSFQEFSEDENAFQNYLVKYNPILDAFNLDSGPVLFKNKDTHVAYEAIHSTSQQVPMEDTSLVGANGTFEMTDMKVEHQDAKINFEKLFIVAKAVTTKEFYDAAGAMGMLDPTIINGDTFSEIFKSLTHYQVVEKIALTNGSVQLEGQSSPIFIPSALVDLSFNLDRGLFDISISPHLEINNLTALQNQVGFPIAIDELTQTITLSFKNMNMAGFKEVFKLQGKGKEDREEIINTFVDIIRPFFTSEPEVGLNIDLAESQARTNIDISIALAPLSEDQLNFSLEDPDGLKMQMKEILSKYSVLSISLSVEDYERLMQIVDQYFGPGFSGMILQQYQWVLVADEKNFKASLVRIGEEELLLNDIPNPALQNMFNLLIQGL